MTISRGVYNQLFEQAPDATEGSKEKVIRLRPTEAKAGAIVMSAKSKIQMWTKDEHDRFLAALEMFPSGPWKKVADFVGTKTPRQTMTHAQKYRQKIHRRQRGLRNQKKTTTTNTSSDNISTTTTTNATHSSNTGNTTPVDDTSTGLKNEPNAMVSPYGVADLQLKTASEAAAAEIKGATNDQLLNILAQQATTIQKKPESMEIHAETVEADAVVSPDATAVEDTDGASNTNLPSLAEILHLGGAEEQAVAAVETEEVEAVTKGDGDEPMDEIKNETQAETEATRTKTETQVRPEDCKCKCTCNSHSVNTTK